MKNTLKTLFGIWGFFILALLAIFFGTISYLLSLIYINSVNIHFWLLKMFARSYLAACDIKVNIINAENIPAKESFIMVSNYQTDLQHLAFIAYFPRRFRFIMSDILSKSPFLGHMLRASGFITINDLILQETTGWERSHGIIKAVHHLTNGENIFIMPEGRTSNTGEVNRFNPGAILMAYESKKPILICATKGAIDIVSTPDYAKIENIRNNMPKIFITWISNYISMIKRGNVSIKIGKTVRIKNISDIDGQTNDLRDSVIDLIDSL